MQSSSLEPSFNLKNISRNLICQGRLGDCWLISAIVALVAHPNRLQALFIENLQLAKMGIFKGSLISAFTEYEHLEIHCA